MGQLPSESPSDNKVTHGKDEANLRVDFDLTDLAFGDMTRKAVDLKHQKTIAP